MRYALLVLIAVISLLLAGCSDKGGTEVVIPEDTSSGAATQAATATSQASTTTSTTSLTLSPAEEALAADKLKKGERVSVSTPYKVMSVGDIYVFAVGVKNIYPKTYNFRLRPNFDNAKSSGLANIIHTDDTVESWIARNSFTSFALENGEERIVPLIVEVKPKVAETQDTIPGSYTFEIVFEYEKISRFWEKYNTGEDLLVIKVKE